MKIKKIKEKLRSNHVDLSNCEPSYTYLLLLLETINNYFVILKTAWWLRPQPHR